MKPKHVGSPAGDSPEQLLLEPCSGACTGVKMQPALLTGPRSVHIWVSSALVGPLAWKGLGSGGGQGPCQGPGGRWATRVEGAVYVQV